MVVYFYFLLFLASFIRYCLPWRKPNKQPFEYHVGDGLHSFKGALKNVLEKSVFGLVLFLFTFLQTNSLLQTTHLLIKPTEIEICVDCLLLWDTISSIFSGQWKYFYIAPRIAVPTAEQYAGRNKTCASARSDGTPLLWQQTKRKRSPFASGLFQQCILWTTNI